ncbi:MAG: 30S ribosome-binding factor RbfA [Gammaproteobacteria bacterium]|nr:30S ribosome-binding factor RbfA [Gammaproteobacteria bacterium]MBU1414303.1 30S ribosome-binding factor RbfA [Gammaproteobacteria bacterium]
MAKEFSRSSRVSEQIHRELSELIRWEIKDPRISPKMSLVTLTDVEVTSDYTHAKVFYTLLAGEEHRAEVDHGLKHSAGFLRRELGKRVRIHHIPELHFVYDTSVERGTRLANLIDEAVKSGESHNDE